MDGSAGTQSTTPPLRMPGSIGELWTMLVAFSALRDWLKLIVLGGAVETCRRSLSYGWASFLDSFFLTAHFEENDTSYDWMLVWLGQHPAWQKAREVQISTRDFRNHDSSPVVLEGEEEEESSLAPSRKLSYLPSFGTTNVMYFRGHRMTVTRNRQYLDEGSTHESLTIRILTRSRSVLHELLLEAKRVYMEDFKHRVTVHCPNAYNDWRPVHRRPKRPLSSVILDEKLKQALLDDAREFLASESWYSERGIPFRRGYLLHGAPGAGKTSLINSIAGALGLDIYVVTLSKRGLDDNALNELISDIPAKAIALMEDIDAAFTHDVQRPSDSALSSSKSDSDSNAGVTLSGLLNAIDGVAAQEGRLLFATTNHVERLDPALSRPGRMDVHVEFGLATKWQAAALFKSFYPPATSDDDLPAADEKLAVAVGEKPSAAAAAAADAAEPSESDPLLLSPPATPSKAAAALSGGDAGAQQSLAIPSPGRLRPPRLPPRVLGELAERFAAAVPDGEFSMAALQGHLMGFKTRPHDAILAVPAFVGRERGALKRIAKLKAEADEKVAAAKDVKVAKDEN